VPEGKTRPAIAIRDLVSVDEIQKVEAVEKEVWSLSDRDVSPTTLLVALKAAGAILLGAFDGDAMIGFAFGVPAYEQGHVSIHSHMVAVLPEYRDLDLGYKLKLAQRDRALAMGLKQMTWTFDPLQSRNAHFNFAKVGTVSDRYEVDFYGNQSSSVLHQNGTDRLWLVSACEEDCKTRMPPWIHSLPSHLSSALTWMAAPFAEISPKLSHVREFALRFPATSFPWRLKMRHWPWTGGPRHVGPLLKRSRLASLF